MRGPASIDLPRGGQLSEKIRQNILVRGKCPFSFLTSDTPESRWLLNRDLISHEILAPLISINWNIIRHAVHHFYLYFLFH